MISSTSNAQATLPGLESALCGCGCGKYFMRSTRGRKRIYINATHKKRVARALANQRRGSSTVRLQPLGWLYLRTEDMDTAKHLWEQLGSKEQAVLTVLCNSALPADDLLAGLSGLFARGLQR